VGSNDLRKGQACLLVLLDEKLLAVLPGPCLHKDRQHLQYLFLRNGCILMIYFRRNSLVVWLCML
jgi:hypothetical protein